MNIRFWGCRGSLPTPGWEVMRTGGNTTCVEVVLGDGTIVVIDAGSGLKALGRSILGRSGVNDLYLLLTHSHWDHLMGFPFFVPAYVPRYHIHVRGGPRAKSSLRAYLDHQMQPPYFPVTFDAMKARFDFSDGEPTIKHIGSAVVSPIRLNHPNGGYGFRFVDEDKVFVFLTDNELGGSHEGGLSVDDYAEFCQGADLLVHDTQYTDAEYRKCTGWGHSTYAMGVDLAAKAGVRRLGLFHHDPDRTDEVLDEQEDWCRRRLAKKAHGAFCFAVREGAEVRL